MFSNIADFVPSFKRRSDIGKLHLQILQGPAQKEKRDDFLTRSEIRHARSRHDPRPGELDTFFYLYVVEESGVLVRVVSLRNLVIAPPGRTLRDVSVAVVTGIRLGLALIYGRGIPFPVWPHSFCIT